MLMRYSSVKMDNYFFHTLHTNEAGSFLTSSPSFDTMHMDSIDELDVVEILGPLKASIHEL